MLGGDLETDNQSIESLTMIGSDGATDSSALILTSTVPHPPLTLGIMTVTWEFLQ